MTRRALALLVLLVAAPAAAGDALAFWDQKRRGANCQNRRVPREYWQAAAAAGLEFVRLLPDGMPSKSRDFLIGDADHMADLGGRLGVGVQPIERPAEAVSVQADALPVLHHPLPRPAATRVAILRPPSADPPPRGDLRSPACLCSRSSGRSPSSPCSR